MVVRVRVTWSGSPVAGGGLSTFYFAGTGTDGAEEVDAVGDFLDDIKANLSNQISFATEPDVDLLDGTTGTLTGSFPTTPRSGTGGNTSEPLPLSSQGLLRLRTGVVVNGRELRGRLFIPGFCENNSDSGAPNAGTRANIEAAAVTLRSDTLTEWQVWSRTHGVSAAVGSASMWTKWAVLRSRRD